MAKTIPETLMQASEVARLTQHTGTVETPMVDGYLQPHTQFFEAHFDSLFHHMSTVTVDRAGNLTLKCAGLTAETAARVIAAVAKAL